MEAQNLLNEKVAKVLGELTGALEDEQKTRRAMIKTIQLHGEIIIDLTKRITKLETK